MTGPGGWGDGPRDRRDRPREWQDDPRQPDPRQHQPAQHQPPQYPADVHVRPPEVDETGYDRLNFRNPGQPVEPPPNGHYHAAHPDPRDDLDPHAGHMHESSAPVSARTRRAVIAILAPAILATLIGLIVLWPGTPHFDTQGNGGGERATGTVSEVVEQSCPDTSDAGPVTGPCGTATVRITGGTGKGRDVSVELPQGPGAPTVHPKDKVVLLVIVTEQDAKYTIVDKQRTRSLWLLAVLAAAVVVAFGRLKGLSALAGLVVSFLVLLFFILPGILDGSPPLLVAVVGSSAIMFAVLYLTHGVNTHTSVAILGTLASLVLTGLLGAGFAALTQLTGFGDEQSVYLTSVVDGVDMRGLLLAGIIIGSLGVLDDVTVTQAATVAELARTPRSRWELYRAAIRVGRAHVGSAVNTLVLAYAGATLPVLLLFTVSGQSVGALVTGQSIASEIVRTLVGTIGLVAAVPITTALATLVAEPPAEDEVPEPR